MQKWSVLLTTGIVVGLGAGFINNYMNLQLSPFMIGAIAGGTAVLIAGFILNFNFT